MTPEEWKAHWQASQQPWRTQPEISASRREYLAARRDKALSAGDVPFNEERLDRADIEWLLETHDGGRGPVYWDDPSQRDRKGLDLRGADLRGVDLSKLPLAGLLGSGRSKTESGVPGVNLAGAQLVGTHLEGSFLLKAHLEGAWLWEVHLEDAVLSEAYLEGAMLNMAHLEDTHLASAHLEGASLARAKCTRTGFAHAHLAGADLAGAYLEGASFSEAHLEGKHVPSDVLERTKRWTPYVRENLPPANLYRVTFDATTFLNDVTLGDQEHGFVTLADVAWNGVNLAVVDWTSVDILGDERIAQTEEDQEGQKKDKEQRLKEYREAVRANRQLATALQGQGLVEEGAHFFYRAQVLQRQVFRRQTMWGPYAFSLFLAISTGYGYKPWRSLWAYIATILIFMALYLLNGHFVAPHLSWDEALVLSVSSFHGRGFFNQTISLGDTYARLSAAEAFIGLIVEATLIATLTQRFFGR